MYTSKERVIRDGYLIAFEGEVMSDEEAAARGLPVSEEDKPKRKTNRRKPKPKAEPAEDESEKDYDEDEEA